MADDMEAEFTSFKEVDWKQQEAEDDLAMQNLLSQSHEADGPALFDESRPLDVGEKADNAEDFEDISDDDLPEEEEARGGQNDGDLPGLTDDMGTSHDMDEDDDLFGPSSPLNGDGEVSPQLYHGSLTLPSMQEPESPEDLRELNFPEHGDSTNQDPNIPESAENLDQLVKQIWPSFEKGVNPNFNEVLPTKPAYYIPRAPLKPPKSVNPTKVSLDLALDQEKTFRTAGPAFTDKHRRVLEAEAKGLVAIIEDSSEEEESDDGFDYTPVNPSETIAGYNWADLEIICSDWESKINPPVAEMEQEPEEEPLDDWEKEFGRAVKRKKPAFDETDFINVPRYPIPNFDNFEKMTAHIAKRVVLDMNDPHLLLDVQEHAPAPKRRRLNMRGGSRRFGSGGVASALSQRFNISNDEAYDALKENHQSKVRATLGNLAVEHSLPALKLQWPYYRVKLDTREARAFHRPAMKFNRVINQSILFSKPGMRKRKEVKLMSSVQEIFKESKDLSLADHYSTATLFEYSEEYPTVLSNFGMGNRIINYYRRKDADDQERPQPEDKIGDVTILLPEDKSPFSNFGMVDPGETIRTIHNGMYRAPIFKHEPKETDFLVIRNSTGISGSFWNIRNIDNLFVVGQQFPSIEIPGPHSRKVTNASKNRMKMIAYRTIKHNPEAHLKIGEITAHIPDSSDMQNRQKLKEFIHYDKVDKVWRMRQGEQVPDEPTIRSMVRPEEVCVIDAMQVGARHLEDSGYGAQDAEEEADEEKEGDDKEKSLEQSLAPWRTSKAFLEASADKAMLELNGGGDPSGCGLAFSFVKISMKGGFQVTKGPSATSASKAEEKLKKQNGGHGYNVKVQQTLYNDTIREIWEKQKANLSDRQEYESSGLDRQENEEEERMAYGQTPRSMATPAGPVDDSASQFSIGSRQSKGKAIRIIRKIRNRYGQLEEQSEVVTDVRVFREYQKRRAAIAAENMNVYEARPTGNADQDKAEKIRIKKELERLNRNKERRHAREKQKGIFRASMEPDAASPSATPAPSIEKPTGTTRKCANCGQAGHIKTNKKLCPMLNGTMKPEDSAASNGGFGAITAPSFS